MRDRFDLVLDRAVFETDVRVALLKGVKISFRIREWRFYRPRAVDSGMKSGAEINLIFLPIEWPDLGVCQSG